MADIRGIVISLTYAELDTLTAISNSEWNGVYLGSQFYVTDKDWLLQTCRDNECKPLSGVMKFMNGELPPAWLTPETLLIDTGTISTDINPDDGTPLTITVPNGYIATKMYIAVLVQSDVLSGISLKDSEPAEVISHLDDLLVGDYILLGLETIKNRKIAIFDGNHVLSAYGNGSTNTCQAIIEFKKSYL